MRVYSGVAWYNHCAGRNNDGLRTDFDRLWVRVGAFDNGYWGVETDRFILYINTVVVSHLRHPERRGLGAITNTARQRFSLGKTTLYDDYCKSWSSNTLLSSSVNQSWTSGRVARRTML